MADEASERIRELQLKIAQWSNEQDQTIQRLRDDQQQRKAALVLSAKVIALGSIPSVLLILYGSARSLANNFTIQQVCFCLGELGVFMILAAAAARASGLFAHWWFRRSFIRARTAVIMTSLAAAALQLLWVLSYSDYL